MQKKSMPLVNRLAGYRYQLDRNSVLNFMGYGDPNFLRSHGLRR
jgi:hypothetical protein